MYAIVYSRPTDIYVTLLNVYTTFNNKQIETVKKYYFPKWHHLVSRGVPAMLTKLLI